MGWLSFLQWYESNAEAGWRRCHQQNIERQVRDEAMRFVEARDTPPPVEELQATYSRAVAASRYRQPLLVKLVPAWRQRFTQECVLEALPADHEERTVRLALHSSGRSLDEWQIEEDDKGRREDEDRVWDALQGQPGEVLERPLDAEFVGLCFGRLFSCAAYVA